MLMLCGFSRVRFSRIGLLGIAAMVCVGAVVTHAFQENRPQRLNPGQQVERTISGPDAHVYEIFLPGGKFLQIVPENTTAPVIANPLSFSLRSSSGEVLAKGDEMSISRGHGRISWIGDQDATYRLEVSRYEVGYWSSSPQASYRIHVLELRDATPTDSHIVDGEKAIVQDNPEAINHFRIAGDLPGLAESLELLGPGVDASLEALKIRRELGDRTYEAANLVVIANSYRNLGEWQNALNYAHEALTVATESQIPEWQSRALTTIGNIYQELGDPLTALDFFSKSLDVGKPLVRFPAVRSNALAGVANAYTALGDSDKALDYKREAADFIHSVGNRNMEALSRNTLASGYVSSGNYDAAADQLNQAMALYRHDNHGAGQMRTWTGIGNLYVARRDAAKAQEAFAAAFEIEKGYTFPDGPELAAPMRIGMGNALLLIGNQQGALNYFNQALESCRRLHDWRCEAEALRRIAEVESSLGNVQGARSDLNAAIELIESVRGRVAGEAFRATYSASKRVFYDSYLDILMRSRADAVALEASERFRMRSFVEMLSEARVDVRQGVDPALLEQEQKLSRQIISGQQALVSASADKTKANVAAAAQKRLDDLIVKHQEVESDIRAHSPGYAALVHPTPLTLTQIQGLLDSDTLLLEYWLGEKSSYVWAVTQNSVTAYPLQKRELVEKEAVQFNALVTARQPVAGDTPGRRQMRVKRADEQYAPRAASFGRMLLGPVAAHLKTKRVLIVADGALHYVPFAALPAPAVGRNRPSECPSSGCLLIHQHEVASLPSVTVLRALRDRKSKQSVATKTVAVFADPVFEREDPRVGSKTVAVAAHPAALALRYLEREMRDVGFNGALSRLSASREEAKAIVAADSSGRSLLALDFEANRDRVMDSTLKDYRIVHFATHGFIDNTHPELSGLVLSLVGRNGVPQDGFLRLHEIYNLQLPADLVVLSACNTALGKQVNGEGLIGLTRGFMYAGASRVMATLWKVDDEAAAEEMAKLYRNLFVRGKAPAAALRDAQLEMLKSTRWGAPYYWSAFTLQGDW
jgi:CHAT domain-containing protein/tetratricopeptide (TPR) repeat protein